MYEEGDLQYVGVVPVGGSSVTNDVAIGLKIDPEMAERVKLEHGRLGNDGSNDDVEFATSEETMTFARADIDEIIEARYEEMFEAVAKELKRAGRAGKLPSGVVLTGGGAQMRGIVEYAKEQLGLSARIGMPTGYSGVSEQAEQPEYAAAIGLMLMDETGAGTSRYSGGHEPKGNATGKMMKKAGGAVSRFMERFR